MIESISEEMTKLIMVRTIFFVHGTGNQFIMDLM